MTPELQEKWVRALTSGDYIQSRGCLKRDEITADDEPDSIPWESYCCLGVLMDISGKTITYNQELPSDDQLDEFGLSNDAAETLSGLNDSGADFNEIASIISAVHCP